MFSRRSPATSPRHLSPLASPSRSRSNSSTSHTTPIGYYEPACRPVQSEEALKVVKGLEQVMSAWNEYRLAVANQARAGLRLAAVMKDLEGRMDKDGVAYHALKPTSRTIDDLSDNTLRYSKRLEGIYDHANTETSRYFQNLARQVRDHEAFLANEGKRAVKSEKAYRKASKVMTDGAIHGSGLEAMKDAMKLEVERASLDHANLLGDAQAAILFKVSAALAGIVGPSVEYHSNGLKSATDRYGEIEHFKALAAAGWRDLALPESIGDQHEATATAEPIFIQHPTRKGKELDLEVDKAYLQPKPSLVRPKLLPYPSSQTTIRSRHSLPPPPMYASRSSLSIPRTSDVGTSSPSHTSSRTSPVPVKPPIPSPALRRVSDIAAQLESLAHQSKETPPVPARPDPSRRVSMPPVLGGSPSGPRPVSVHPFTIAPTAPKLTDTSYTSPTASSSNTSSAILLSPASLPAPDGPQARRGMGLGKKQQVSFAGDEGSFPWHLSSGSHRMDVRLLGKDAGGEGMIQPSPRRVPSLSPELRGLMAG